MGEKQGPLGARANGFNIHFPHFDFVSGEVTMQRDVNQLLIR